MRLPLGSYRREGLAAPLPSRDPNLARDSALLEADVSAPYRNLQAKCQRQGEFFVYRSGIYRFSIFCQDSSEINPIVRASQHLFRITAFGESRHIQRLKPDTAFLIENGAGRRYVLQRRHASHCEANS